MYYVYLTPKSINVNFMNIRSLFYFILEENKNYVLIIKILSNNSNDTLP